MAANCTGPSPKPCGACKTCRPIAAGSHPDVILVEPDPEKATATIAVEQVREVVRVAQFHRYGAAKRFVIVDPAEAMLPAAANALLKTLEEPPAGTHFVLIATHGSALLPTIVSRCQRLRFGPVPEGELVPWLRAKGFDAAEALARLSLGCPGRALALADGAFDERTAIRDGLVAAVHGELGDVFAFSEKICAGGSRQEWQARVEIAIGVLEDLLRDVVITGSEAKSPALDPAAAAIVTRWTPVLYPGGVTAIAASIGEARDHLVANASGRTVVDALLARVRAELGRRAA
jgi:DNA polymerase-3 subunit delta'